MELAPPIWLFVLLSVNIVPSFQQDDSLCTNHSPSAKHYSTSHYCYWLTLSNGTADSGSIACQAAGGYIGFIESNPDLLSFIHDGLDNYWSQTGKVFVGLRSWDSNNAFTHWDSEPIYTFDWDYAEGEPDAITYNEFCVTLSAKPSHPWHNERCDKIFQSLCYCRLDLGSAKHICSSPTASNATSSSSLPVVSQTFLITTAMTSLTPSPASAYSTIPWSIPVSSSLTSSDHLSPAASVMYGSTYLFSSSISSWTFTTVTSTIYVTSCNTASSTSSIYSSVASSYASCCPCHASSNSTNSTTVVPLTDLKVDKTTTSRYLRTKYSAADGRPLSQFLGTSAIIIIVVIIGAIVAWDVTIIAKQVKNKFKHYKRELKKKLGKGRINSLEMEH